MHYIAAHNLLSQHQRYVRQALQCFEPPRCPTTSQAAAIARMEAELADARREAAQLAEQVGGACGSA